MNTKTSDTPRTDALLRALAEASAFQDEDYSSLAADYQHVLALARTLERDNARLRAALTRLVEAVDPRACQLPNKDYPQGLRAALAKAGA